jgi:ABC-type antimicrobial peptide transport system permease subunit
MDLFEAWGEQHGCLMFFVLGFGYLLSLSAVAAAYFWLKDQGTGGMFVLGLIVGAVAGGAFVAWRMRERSP